jgi:hypothetical protein
MLMSNDLLAGYIRAQQLATDPQIKKTYRTVLNWMNQPDGLPYIQLGNQRLIHLETARAWLMSRMRQRNPARRRRERKR